MEIPRAPEVRKRTAMMPGSLFRPDLEAAGFAGWRTWDELRADDYPIPRQPLVYVIYRASVAPARFRETNPGGHIKGKDPTETTDIQSPGHTSPLKICDRQHLFGAFSQRLLAALGLVALARVPCGQEPFSRWTFPRTGGVALVAPDQQRRKRMRQVMNRSSRPGCLRLRLDVYESGIGGDIALLRQDPDNADWLRPSKSIADPERDRRLVAIDAVTSSADAEQLLRSTCDCHPWANGFELPSSDSTGDGVGVACLIADIVLDPAPYRLEEIPIVGDTIGPAVGMHATPWPYSASTSTTNGEAEAVLRLLEEFSSELPDELWREDG